MTYTFKLARRLAVLRTLGMLPAVLLFASCYEDATAPETRDALGPEVPAAVSVNPKYVTVETNQLIRFLAHGRNGSGDSVYAPITWRASGGTILPDGRFSSTALGTFVVTGMLKSGTGYGSEEFEDTSFVEVVRRWPLLRSIEIAPQSVTLAPGVSQSFLATGRLKDGRPVPVGTVWNATGGTIDAGGKYVAGDTAGTYQVVAINPTRMISDTALVTITAPAPPPPPPSGSPPEDPPGPEAPIVTQVILKPASATLAPQATRQFKVYGRTSAGDSVPVSVAFKATGGTVTPAGLYTAGLLPGTFRVIASVDGVADTSSLTISSPLGSGSPSAGCLARSGPLVSITSAASSRYDTRLDPLAEATRVDARTASWTGWSYPVNAAAKPGLCWTGGKIQGTLEETASWSTWHSSAAIYIYADQAIVENLRADNHGDGVRFTPNGTRNWTLRGVHFSNMHDDCVENDRLESGLVEDVLLDGCYVGFSARPGDGFQHEVNGSGNTVTVRNSLVRLQRQVSVYKGPSPSSGGFFKVEHDLVGINVSWVVEGNIFRADGPSGFATLCLNQQGRFTARDNIMVWLGEGDYPCALPSGWRLTRDKSVWDNAVADWKARHPTLQH